MICHVVLFKFHDGVRHDDPRFLEADRDVRVLPEAIPGILECGCGRDFADRDMAYDYAVIGTFENGSAVASYPHHPVHVRGVDQWRQFSTWVVTDFEL
ncbi:hypothetical protein GCM10010145_58380 [Streptomyces ruber]|uniref:Stress-response A/B barrel domain-containing protein n=2 Tax=Streptomyces TaxID=1883 RepID=A0A918BQJ2_9ACTN|nr:Dabb family protein [Streptomyces ruber]GGQ80974.1 hypothetical protein GCM10010145_58380 [Streptomyces ruber]